MPKPQGKAEVHTEPIALGGRVGSGVFRVAKPTTPAVALCRLGLYDPMTGKFIRWEGPVLDDTQHGRSWAREVIREFIDLTADDPNVKLCMALFPWE